MIIRNATMNDAPVILRLVNAYAKDGLMLLKSPYQVYRSIQSFFVAEEEGQVVGCCRLNVIWKDLAEVASLAVDSSFKRRGIGQKLVFHVIEQGVALGIYDYFTLTYQNAFFEKCNFTPIDRNELPHKVFSDCLMCPKIDSCDEFAYSYKVPRNDG